MLRLSLSNFFFIYIEKAKERRAAEKIGRFFWWTQDQTLTALYEVWSYILGIKHWEKSSGCSLQFSRQRREAKFFCLSHCAIVAICFNIFSLPLLQRNFVAKSWQLITNWRKKILQRWALATTTCTTLLIYGPPHHWHHCTIISGKFFRSMALAPPWHHAT